MSWEIALFGGVAAVLVLLLLGFPVFVVFLVLNLAGVYLFFGSSGSTLLANSIYATATFSSLPAVPLFIIMGEVLFRCGAMDALFRSLDELIGRIRGRQYVLSLIASAIIGALSGAAMAVAGLLGRTLLPAMLKRGYDKKLTLGTILGGASLDPIIPPSSLAVLIAALAEVSTSGMLIGGIVPGFMLMGIFIGYTLVRVSLNPALAPDARIELAQNAPPRPWHVSVASILPCAVVFFLVMGFIMLGIATPTESAATGVAGALIAAAIYRGLSWNIVAQSLRSAIVVTSLLLVVMSAAAMFSQLMAFSGSTQMIADLIKDLPLAPPVMLFLMMALPFILFMFLDQLALMMVLVPIYQPMIKHYGFDPLWFWTMFLMNVTAGGLSPPFGYTLFALKSAAENISLEEIYSSAWPFLWLLVLGIVLVALFPQTVLYLPSVAK
jgi:tripartite ATP-independent transporter DctM subunit